MDHADYMELDLALAKLEVGVCTETIIASGIRRFFIASKNPNPSVIGNRIRFLRDAGIEAIMILCKKEADFSNRAFLNLKYQKTYVNYLLDNPFLTTRLPHGGKNPIRIILDRCLKHLKLHALLNGGVS